MPQHNKTSSKRKRSPHDEEANFLVEAARIKLTEISAQLNREEVQIKHKKEIAKLFVCLLTEWLNHEEAAASTPSAVSPAIIDGIAISGDQVANFLRRKGDFLKGLKAQESEAMPSFDRTFVADLLNRDAFDSLRASTERFCINTLHDSVTMEEVRASARTLLASREMRAEDEAMLRRITTDGDDKLASEYACLLSILLKNFEDWHWNKEVLLDGRVLYCRVPDKLRLIGTSDTVTSLFLEVLGRRWSRHLRESVPNWREACFGSDVALFEATDFKDTNVLLKKFWCDQSIESFLTSLPKDEDGDETGAVVYQMEHMERLLMTIAAAHRFNQVFSSPSGGALGMLQSDIKNFGLSVDHNLVLMILESIGATPKWLSFFRKYVSEWCMDVDGEEYRPLDGRGLLLAHTLTHVCTELVLYLLDLSMAKIGHPMLRVHDDFVLCGSGVQELEEAWTHCVDTIRKLGLEHNASKTSVVFLPGKEVTSAPVIAEDSCLEEPMKRNFTIRGLVLEKDGWQVNRPFWERLVQPLRAEGASIFGLLNQYNMQLRSIRKELGPVCRVLGLDHAKAITSAMAEVERCLCSGTTETWEEVTPSLTPSKKEPPFVAWLTKELRRRFPAECSNLEVLQPGWFFWPVAAGGLFAEHASLRAESVARSLKEDGYGSQHTEVMTDDRPYPPRKWDQYLEWRKGRPRWLTDAMRKEVVALIDAKAVDDSGSESCPFVTVTEYDDCVRHASSLKLWARNKINHLKRLTSRDEVREEAPPVVEDRQLRELVDKFCKRTNEFGNFGGHTTGGLGGYMKNVVARYGSDLQSTFGTLGLIPADLAPHSLLDTIRSERKSKEIMAE